MSLPPILSTLLCRDVQRFRLYEGASQIQQFVIARETMKAFSPHATLHRSGERARPLRRNGPVP